MPTAGEMAPPVDIEPPFVCTVCGHKGADVRRAAKAAPVGVFKAGRCELLPPEVAARDKGCGRRAVASW
jgi:hypothetical protein